MAAPAKRYACQECGASHGKWSGRCDACGAWNVIVEELPREATPKGLGGGAGRKLELVSLRGDEPEPPRITTGISELDRAFGGGLVRGSAVLISGDPGIGKSTLLLQAAVALASRDAFLRLHLGRGSHRAAQATGRTPRARRGAGAACRGDQRPRHSDQP